jgi:vesicle-fusing ATPase
LGLRSGDKGDKIRKVFEDAYKSKESFIVIDCIEMLVEYVDVGPNFSNTVLQILRTLIKKVPPNPECRLMIVGTTSKYN